ncbi:three-Cys-motif partner protein TcmP [Collinsella sp. An268]|uniref:three-Cys-motif partner protein TcmP n=1 Tax=Collinsella sp. An268 TaxID=1965612 RepID=UPI00130253B8|nr:three-Cys-motif partner protein TcmP [Collinsella sp. An268]
MAKESNTFGGEWSIKKLDCVESYLRSYLKVMMKKNWAELYYIDAFSGNGIQRFEGTYGEDQFSIAFEDELIGKFVEGSSMRALKVSDESERSGERGFKHFCFLELSGDKLSELRSRIEDSYPHMLARCKFIQGDVNDTLPELVRSIPWKEQRGVMFIDPWATQLSWSSVESLRGARCDIWMLFPLGAIIRMLPGDHLPPREFEGALTRIFGDDGWKDLYRHERGVQLSLFDEEGQQVSRQRGTKELIDYTTDRLRTVSQCVCGPAELRTSTNAPLFALYSMLPAGSQEAIRPFKAISNHLLKSIA